MPEEVAESTNSIRDALEQLEDKDFNDPLSRRDCYKVLQTSVEKDVDAETARRILVICVNDSTSLNHTIHITNIINLMSTIVSKVKLNKYDPEPDLVPSARAIINVLKNLAALHRVESLRTLSYQTLITFPVNTLTSLVETCDDVLELIDLHCHVEVPKPATFQAFTFLHKIFKILPPEQKRVFVKKGISVWFSNVFPFVMSNSLSSDDNSKMMVEVLEMLTDEIVHFEYADDPDWNRLVECICKPKQYPSVLRGLLSSQCSAWAKLWIIFIRLLKNHVTKVLENIGTPINSLLPVVETAFKMDSTSRCLAFKCWTVLIDNFATETNEHHLQKRLKLLIIPLRANNARHNDIALAKFKCWWHLIWKFQNRMDKYLDTVLLSFLNFCFDKHNIYSLPGQLSDNVKKQCTSAIVDLVGHVDCNGCTGLPKLNHKLISTKYLVDNWNHWMYLIRSVIKKTATNDGLTNQQMTCLWKSFLRTIGELPENNIRKDLFSEILTIVEQLLEEQSTNKEFLEVIFNIIILSLFHDNTKIKHLFKSDQDANDPIVRILKILVNNSTLHEYYKSLPSRVLITKFKAFTRLFFVEGLCTSRHIANFILPTLPKNDIGLMMWTALTESMCEAKSMHCLLVTHNILLWPLKSMTAFTEVKIPATTWYKSYIATYPKLSKTDIDKEISEILFNTPDGTTSTTYFKLYAVLGILKHRSAESDCLECEKEVNYLLNLTKSIDNYGNYEEIFPILVDKIVTIMTIAAVNVNENVAAFILICVKNVLHVLSQACTQSSDSDISTHIMLMGHLLKPLEVLFAVESYKKLIPAMTYHLLKNSQLLAAHSTTHKIILSIMKTILTKTDITHPNYNKVKSVIKDIESGKFNSACLDQNSESKFTAPELKDTTKKLTKKKEASIVNTVVENGEEYVVVKSNWKFNPKKLTENQKEKFQRKREDIPALYQDLSQSQDEFKLATWKTDSQDTTSSSKSESKSNKPDSSETATEILKNIPSTNVVPKILENFFAEKEKNDGNVKSTLPMDNFTNVDNSTHSPKNAKEPRMALKDRVFRNVRNLIENSGIQKENKVSSEDPNKTDNIIKTPTHTKVNNTANIVNSAPPLLSAERPSRVKRKPKKFEDLHILTSKRSRHSLHEHKNKDSNNDGQQSSDFTESESSQDSDIIPIIENTPNNEKVQVIDCDADVNTNKDLEKGANSNVQSSKTVESDIVMIDDDSNEDIPQLIQDSTSLPIPITAKSFRSSVDVDLSKDVVLIEDEAPPTLLKDSEIVADASTNVTQAPSKKLDNVISCTSTANEEPTMNKVQEIPFKNLTILFTCKELPPKSSNADKEITPSMLNSVKQILPPKILIPVKDASSPRGSKSVKEVSSPSLCKDSSLVTAAKTSKPVNEDLNPDLSTDAKEISTPIRPKPVTVEVSTPKTSKAVKDASTPKSSKPAKNDSGLSLSNDSNVMLTPKSSKQAKEDSIPSLSTDITDVSTAKTLVEKVTTPKTPRSVKVASTPKNSKSVKNYSTPGSSKDASVVTTPKSTKSAKEIPTPSLPTDGKEVLTSKKSKCPVDEVSFPGASHQIKDVSISKVSKCTTEASASHITSSESPQVLITRVCIGTKDMSRGSQDLTHECNLNTSLDLNKVVNADIPNEGKELVTPKSHGLAKQSPKSEERSTSKKRGVKKSKIEKELAIDTVEGHPFLKHTTKRLTRKTLESANTGRRKSLAEKLNRSKSEFTSNTKIEKKIKEKNKESVNTSPTSVVVGESQERDGEPKQDSSFSKELPYSDDVIESSQDSTITTISVKSTKKTPMKVPIICVEKLASPTTTVKGDMNISQSILDRGIADVPRLSFANNESRDDSVLPVNKTVSEQKAEADLTENMDTEPADENYSDMVTNDNTSTNIVNTDAPVMIACFNSSSTQEIAEADTQPTDPNDFTDIDEVQDNVPETSEMVPKKAATGEMYSTTSVVKLFTKDKSVTSKSGVNDTENNVTLTLSDSACANIEQSSGASSPFKDEAQRQKDFLNNTIEISPIKTMSPNRNRSPSPETSGDFVVITLSSPVQSNGEPFDKYGSPEVFTEDKVSPERRDQSPPRVEISLSNTSPSSSLSLKKNRPQVRSGGRAAQMLVLCVPDKVQAIVNPERNESEEVKKVNTSNTPARRNLRMLYSSVNDNPESSNSNSENDEGENFLKFRRSLPAVDCSPSGPILKRKLAEITDDATVSPASKRKRVSFHDPPVSTTISVQKYIDPGVMRSPQNSAQKRLERQLRQHTPLKSPKRLDSVFKLDTVLTKAVESFTDNDVVPISDDTQQFSLDETPIVEIIRTSELNDTDPIFPDLLDCKDSIENIAGELSSPAMKSLLIKELEGKIETVGDLAKMTELQVNRLCIKAPKVKVAKKVLEEYALKRVKKDQSAITISIDEAEFDAEMAECETKGIDTEVQTDENKSIDMEVQTVDVVTRIISVQTDTVPHSHTSIQTEESGSRSTSDIIKLCLTEKPDFVEQLGTHLEETAIQRLSEKLPLNILTDLLVKKITPSETETVLSRILESSTSSDRSKEMSFLRDYMCERFDPKDLILLCSQILKVVYDRPV